MGKLGIKSVSGLNYERPEYRYALMLSVLLSVLEKLRKHTYIYCCYIYIILQILSHQSCQLFLCAIIFKHLSIIHLCYL